MCVVWVPEDTRRHRRADQVRQNIDTRPYVHIDIDVLINVCVHVFQHGFYLRKILRLFETF